MTSHSVSAFQLTVRNPEIKGRDKHSQLDSVVVKKKKLDFLDVVEDFLEANSSNYKTVLINQSNRLIKVESIVRQKGGRDISFFVRQGTYGVPGDIISSRSLKPTYKRKSEESDVGRYFVQIRVPVNSKTAYAVLHFIGNSGVKSWLSEHLGSYVNMRLSGCALNFRPLCSTLVLQAYLKDADVRSIRISNFEPEMAGDIANYLTDDKVEKVLTLRREGGFGKLGTFLRKGVRRDQLIALSDAECNDVKADVTFNGHSRTVSLEGSKTPKAKFYLTEPGTQFDDGLPTRQSISAYATALLDDLVNEAVGA